MSPELNKMKFRLMRYAEFIHANASYVVSAALERLFNKDAEFQEYLEIYKPPQAGNHSEEEYGQPSHADARSTPTK